MKAVLQNMWITTVDSELEAAELAMSLDTIVRGSLDAEGHTDAMRASGASYLGSSYVVIPEEAYA